jgi:large subunit ribosomal protein L15
MGTTLSDLKPPAGAKHKRKRVGRGPGSGSGTTASRGQKGQSSRSGGGMGPWFEGGQMPLQRRLPKRGFVNNFRVEYYPVNVGQLALAFSAGEVVDVAALIAKGLVPRKATHIKVLGSGQLAHSLTVKVQGFSKSGKEKVEAAGGTAVVIDPVKRGRAQAAAAAQATASEQVAEATTSSDVEGS